MAFYHSLNADIRRERPVDEIFAKGQQIDWFKQGEDPNKPAATRPFSPPEAWKGFPAQPIIGVRPPFSQKTPWLYGEAPDLARLIGNAIPGYGS